MSETWGALALLILALGDVVVLIFERRGSARRMCAIRPIEPTPNPNIDRHEAFSEPADEIEAGR